MLTSDFALAMINMMRRAAQFLLVVGTLLLFARDSFAKLDVPDPFLVRSKPVVHIPFKLPPHAQKITEELYKLPQALDRESRLNVEAYAIIHKKDRPKKSEARNNNVRRRQTRCYGFFANGAKWKMVEPWIINASGSGLLESFVLSNLASDISKWEDATDGTVGNGGLDVLGNGSATDTQLIADTSSPDNLNEVYFGAVDDPDIIAVTILWGYFGGLVSQRRLVEWDQIYSSAYLWSATGEANKMDFENIVSHELGHSVGLIDLYNSSCTDETMYGYATEGETKKRDLNSGDITGMNKLY